MPSAAFASEQVLARNSGAWRVGRVFPVNRSYARAHSRYREFGAPNARFCAAALPSATTCMLSPEHYAAQVTTSYHHEKS